MPLFVGVLDTFKGHGRFLIEAVLWWMVITVPINTVSIWYASQAPPYIHSDVDTYCIGYGQDSLTNCNLTKNNGEQSKYIM